MNNSIAQILKEISSPIESFDKFGFNEYSKFLEYNLSKYCDILSKILSEMGEEYGDYIEFVEEINKSIIDSVNYHVNGYHGKSYSVFKNMMSSLKSEVGVLEINAIEDRSLLSKKVFDIDPYDFLKLVDITLNGDELDLYYRCRKAKDNEKFISIYDLFHINYKDYHKIRNYRFSVPGYPCLYLSSSFECCYDELDRPNIEDLWISTYRLNKNLRFLDLSKNIEDILINFKEFNKMKRINSEAFNKIISEFINIFSEYPPNTIVGEGVVTSTLGKCVIALEESYREDFNYDETEVRSIVKILQIIGRNSNVSEIIDGICATSKILEVFCASTKLQKKMIDSYLLVFPIQIACSIKKKSDGYYIPEYIIPQHLMQWIREEKKFDGIKYRSTIYADDKDSSKSINLVIPAINSETTEDGYSHDLIEYFEISNPEKVIMRLGIEDLVRQIGDMYRKK